jgi:hypothetical protein
MSIVRDFWPATGDANFYRGGYFENAGKVTSNLSHGWVSEARISIVGLNQLESSGLEAVISIPLNPP